mmetsp:Transcript_58377/g.126950  ORF Transcript_58377/g.126950 Transcript_58377/m.126950 type:complete len:331 (-) Transcript_58377:272-1264(-)
MHRRLSIAPPRILVIGLHHALAHALVGHALCLHPALAHPRVAHPGLGLRHGVVALLSVHVVVALWWLRMHHALLHAGVVGHQTLARHHALVGHRRNVPLGAIEWLRRRRGTALLVGVVGGELAGAVGLVVRRHCGTVDQGGVWLGIVPDGEVASLQLSGLGEGSLARPLVRWRLWDVDPHAVEERDDAREDLHGRKRLDHGVTCCLCLGFTAGVRDVSSLVVGGEEEEVLGVEVHLGAALSDLDDAGSDFTRVGEVEDHRGGEELGVRGDDGAGGRGGADARRYGLVDLNARALCLDKAACRNVNVAGKERHTRLRALREGQQHVEESVA